jgi:hypothetical protein
MLLPSFFLWICLSDVNSQRINNHFVPWHAGAHTGICRSNVRKHLSRFSANSQGASFYRVGRLWIFITIQGVHCLLQGVLNGLHCSEMSFWDILFSRWSRWRANSVIIGTKILVLYGVWTEVDENMLVYEYIPGRSMDLILFLVISHIHYVSALSRHGY